jgi:tetrahydromethanopterin S-methyltransferase subunit G
MNVLDTFFLLFEADASKLNKGLDDADRRAKLTTKEVKALDDAAYKMGERLGDSLKTLGGAVLGLVAVRGLMTSFNSAVMVADKLDEQAKALDINIEELSAYGDAAKEAGGSAEGFRASLQGLNENLVMMATTGKSRAAPFLKELGIDLTDVKNKGKTAFDFLPDIADAFAKLGAQESLAMGKKIGFDIGTIMMLQGGKRELNELIAKHKELGVVTQKQGEIAAKYNDQLDDARHVLRSLWLSMSEVILPVVTKIVGAFETVVQFVRRHSHFIVGLFGAIGVAIGTLVLPMLWQMAVATAIAFAPYLLIGGIVAGIAVAFALLYDDVMSFLEGSDSLIGQLLTKFPMLAQVFYIIGAVAKEIAGVIESAFNLAGGAILVMWDHIAARVMALWGYVKEFAGFVGGIASKLGGALTSHQFGGADIAPGVAAGREALGLASSTPLASQTSNSISNRRGGDRSTSVQVDKIEVQTQATDAAGISKAVGKSMGAQLSQTAANFDDGVAA